MEQLLKLKSETFYAFMSNSLPFIISRKSIVNGELITQEPRRRYCNNFEITPSRLAWKVCIIIPNCKWGFAICGISRKVAVFVCGLRYIVSTLWQRKTLSSLLKTFKIAKVTWTFKTSPSPVTQKNLAHRGIFLWWSKMLHKMKCSN